MAAGATQWNLAQKVLVAKAAWAVFALVRDPAIEEVLNLPNPGKIHDNVSRGLTVHHLITYLSAYTGESYWPHALHIERLIAEMERAGLLMEHPFVRNHEPAPFSRYYWSAGNVTDVQRQGAMWLSAVLGPSLIIPSFGSVTMAITGTPTTQDRAIGSGLVLDERHVLTAGHVVDGMVVDDLLSTSSMAPRAATVRVAACHRSNLIDLAVIEVLPTEDAAGLEPLPGVGFRDPRWGDTTYVFGYPPSPFRDGENGPNLIVQRGEVVNPEVTGYDRRPHFLYSAIARPGASGGPIVAQDGRVIGMVIEEGIRARNTLGDDLSKSEQTELGVGGFYTGVPSTEILFALHELGLGHLAGEDSQCDSATVAAVSTRAAWPE